MSQTAGIFFSKHAKAWKAIVSSAAYKDAIDTVHQTNESLHILGYSPPEVAGVGAILFAKQQGALEILNALTALSDVPPEIGSEDPPENDLYPDPLDEIEVPNRTKPKPRKKG